uniref:Alpha-type protein kinase domain-containing protein n=1 Tax=Strigamia maritima TaxID=126957 RepID=T1JKZ2_STRMM
MIASLDTYDDVIITSSERPVKKPVLKEWRKGCSVHVDSRTLEVRKTYFRAFPTKTDSRFGIYTQNYVWRVIFIKIGEVPLKYTLAHKPKETATEHMAKKTFVLPNFLMDVLEHWNHFLEGKFHKICNNDMTFNTQDNDNDMELKASALAHFSLHFSDNQALITDIQRVGYKLTDPKVATIIFMKKKSMYLLKLFNVGNMSVTAYSNFISTHVCNTATLQAFQN